MKVNGLLPFSLPESSHNNKERVSHCFDRAHADLGDTVLPRGRPGNNGATNKNAPVRSSGQINHSGIYGMQSHRESLRRYPG